jgi:tetratricopeptide (TPR) repeat protein
VQNPEHCVAHFRLARAYLADGQAERAIEALVKVIGNPRCPIQEAYLVKGLAEAELGNFGEAGRSFDECVAVSPRSCVAHDCRRRTMMADR